MVVADTRRATEWEAGLEAEGFDVARVETRGADAEKGAWQIGVRRAQLSRARHFVSEVTRGERSLPVRSSLSRTGLVALVGVVVILVGLVLAGLFR